MDNPPLPVICDRCGARGHAGGVDFTQFGDLLDFEPVPRKQPRADGWTPEVQRYFIAALALTGSERQAAQAVGKAPFGVTQLRKAEGNESFMAAYARAMAFYEEEHSRRLSEGLQAAATHAAHRHAPTPPAWSGAATRQPSLPPPAPTPAEEAQEEEAQLAALAQLIKDYMLKLRSERQARLAGRIAEADFYLRQITWFETAMDAISGDVVVLLRDFRHGGRDLIELAASPMAMLLDEARREHWAAMGEPKRPEHPPRHLIQVEPDGMVMEPTPCARSGQALSMDEQWEAFKEQHRKDAEAQLVWEAEALAESEAWARRDDERRREATPPMDEEPRPAGQPAPEA